MGFTPYSQMVNLAQWTDPMDLNMYAKGLAYREEIAKNNLENLSQSLGAINSINTYGVDAQQLDKIKGELRERLSSLSGGNLTDLNTFSQMKGIINEFSNRDDTQAIYKRISTYNREMQAKKKAEEKGNYYSSPALESLESYWSGKDFYTNPEGLNLSSGWLSPDVTKFMKEIRESAKKKVYDSKSGMVKEIIDPRDASALWGQYLSTNPNLAKEVEWSFQKETKGIDWETKGREFIDNKTKETLANYQSAVLSGDADGQAIYQRELQRLSSMADPKIIGDELRSQYRNSWFQNQMDKVGYSMDMASFEGFERDPLQMEQYKTSNSFALEKFRTDENIRQSLAQEIIKAGFTPEGKEIVLGGKKLSQTKAKAEKEQNLTEKQRERKMVIDSIRAKGKIDQDHVSLLADNGEIVTLEVENGKYIVVIQKANNWYKDNNGEIVPIGILQGPPIKVDVYEYIRNRTGEDLKPPKQSSSASTQTSSKVTGPSGSTGVMGVSKGNMADEME